MTPIASLRTVADLLGSSRLGAREAASQGKIDVRPRKAPIERQTITAATADHVISIRGAGAATVRNLHFEGLDIAAANRDTVFLTSAADCRFRACRIENAGERGVYVHHAAERITAADSEVCLHGLNGVEFKGAPFGGPDINKHHVVENCRIHHCGILIGHGAGVRIGGKGVYGRTFEQWKRHFDKNSLTVDPRFVDPARHDCRLQANWPAVNLGIKSIDTAQIGLTDKYPARLSRE
jgi:hypothetical protein